MHDCCANPGNRKVEEERDGITVQVCGVCGRRHFEVTADPILIEIRKPEGVI